MTGRRALMGRLLLAATAACALVATTGCTRYAYTRVFLHGQIEDEDGRPVPFAILRFGDFETLADESGHYRLLYLASCLRGTVGFEGIQSPELTAFSFGYETSTLAYHLDTIGSIGGGSCPADSDRFLKLALVRKK